MRPFGPGNILDRLVADRRVEPGSNAYVLACTYASVCNHNDGITTLDANEVCDLARIGSRRSRQVAHVKLVDLGYLARVEAGGGAGKRARYRLVYAVEKQRSDAPETAQPTAPFSSENSAATDTKQRSQTPKRAQWGAPFVDRNKEDQAITKPVTKPHPACVRGGGPEELRTEPHDDSLGDACEQSRRRQIADQPDAPDPAKGEYAAADLPRLPDADPADVERLLAVFDDGPAFSRRGTSVGQAKLVLAYAGDAATAIAEAQAAAAAGKPASWLVAKLRNQAEEFARAPPGRAARPRADAAERKRRRDAMPDI